MKIQNQKLIATLSTILVMYIAGGTTIYHFVEGWNWLDSLYFSVITLSTVGYGDFSPQTNLGKMITIPFIFIGVGLFVAVANAVLANRGAKIKDRREQRQTDGD